MDTPNAVEKKNGWAKLAPRERAIIGVAVGLISLVLLWVAIVPAVKTLRSAPEQEKKLDTQLSQVRHIGQQVAKLKNANATSFDQSYQALMTATQEHLAESGKVALIGDQVNVALLNVNAHYLAQWLSAVRNNAKALPTQVKMDAIAPPQALASSGINWSGVVTFELPPRE